MTGREDAQKDQEQHGIPNPQTGVGIGATGEGSTFEPEEDPAPGAPS